MHAVPDAIALAIIYEVLPARSHTPSKEGELDARRAGVQNKDGVAHDFTPVLWRATSSAIAQDPSLVRVLSARLVRMIGTRAPSTEKARAWCCRCATPRRCSFISTIAAKVAPRAHAILIFDQAGWHGAKSLKTPSNVSLIPLPPRAPELNPQENIWQFMRANWLSNRMFKSYDDIVDHCCYAWNTLVDQPWKIMSIARRDWAAISQSL